MVGRRLPDLPLGDLPSAVHPGDYWKCLVSDGSRAVEVTDRPSNLTGTMWMFMPPNGCGIGTLRAHTVREHEDGTVSVAPGDGSSNSILITGASGSWHGYIDHGVWTEC